MNGVKLLTRLTIGLVVSGGLLLWFGGGRISGPIGITGFLALKGGGIAFIGLIVAIVVQSLRNSNK